MELDQRNLQFLFNVIAITGITSLAAICYFLKRENQELLNKSNPLPDGYWHDPELLRELDRHDVNLQASLPPAVSVPKPDTPIQKEPEVQPEIGMDIRQYMTRRVHR
jgi:hypothetical protein